MEKSFNKEYKENPSLLDVFKQGDRVKQIYYDPNGYKHVYSGKVVDIKKHCIAVQWDKINGSPKIDIDEKYNLFYITEVFNGDEYYSPIIKE